MKIVCVTCITGGVDDLWDPTPELLEGINEFICFTDNLHLKSQVWEFREACTLFDPHYNSRRHKILMHEYVDCDYSIWVDASMILKDMPIKTVRMLWHYGFEFGAFRHWLDNWIDGAQEVRHRDNPFKILEQIGANIDRGLPRDYPLYVGGYLARKHSPRVQRFNEIWWQELLNYSKRDQISLGFAAHQADLPVLNLGNFHEQEFFKYREHNHREYTYARCLNYLR